MRGKKKDAVFEGNVECTDIVVFNGYDTKPVTFLSMASENLV